MILYSKIMGEGTPLLVIHGLFGASDNWGTLGKKLAEHFQVHLIDLRNHGKSFHTDEMNYDLMAEDLTRYIAHYQLENIYVLGHSMGGKASMQLATSHPELVEKLIVADIAPKVYPPHHQHIMKALLSIDFTKLHTRNAVEEAMSQYISDVGIRAFLMKNVYWKTETELAFRMNVNALAEHYDEIMQSDLKGVFDKPTLFLKGEKSFYIEEGDLPMIRQYFPQAELQTIKNAGHWLHAENPNDFLAACLQFLG